KEEIDLWMQQDALAGFGAYLRQHGHIDDTSISDLQEEIVERLVKVLNAAVSLEVSPRFSIGGEEIGGMMFSNQRRDRMADGTPEVLQPLEESRLSSTLAKFRFGLDEDGKPRPKL